MTINAAPQESLRRGFKTWAENTAVNARAQLGLQPTAPLSPEKLAQHLNVVLLKLAEVPGFSSAAQKHLTEAGSEEWSGVTVYCDSVAIIVVNPTNSIGRKASTIMHELSHIICGHEPSKVFVGANGITLRDYAKLQEEEANWLSGCLLLPRVALVALTAARRSRESIYREYSVSADLYDYRMRVTGVAKQAARSQR